MIATLLESFEKLEIQGSVVLKDKFDVRSLLTPALYLFITISGIQHMVKKKKKKKSRQAMRIIRKRVEDSIHDRSPDLDAI